VRVARAALLLALFIAPAACPAPAGAALSPGALDTGFGTNGLVQLDPALAAPKDTNAYDIALDAQGRILVVGGGRDAAGYQAISVQRLAPDGAVDMSFGEPSTPGLFVRQLGTRSPGPSSFGIAVVPAPDGGVFVGAYRFLATTDRDVAALRLTSQGRLDLNYGSSGIAAVALPAGAQLYGTSFAGLAQTDGSFVMAGTYFGAPTGPQSATLIGFGPTGQPSTTITSVTAPGINPQQLSDLATAGSRLTDANAIAPLAAGKYLIGGVTVRTTEGTVGFVARLNASGALDASYGGSTVPGVVLLPPGAGTSPSSSVIALANGPSSSVYAVGRVSTPASSTAADQVFISRFGASGQADGGFGGTGTRTLQLAQCVSTGCSTTPVDARVDAAGRVIVLVQINNGSGQPQFAVARYNPDGNLDAAFGTDGISYGPPPASQQVMDAMEVQGADRLLLGGYARDTQSHAALTRLALENIPDPPAPTPTPTPTPTPNPLPDRTAPKLTKVKVGVVARTRRASLGLTSSEAGRLSIKVLRARSGRIAKGRCSTTAKRGRRCIAYVAYRSLSRTLATGQRTFSLGSPLAVGSYRAVVTATDRAGNRARSITVSFTVKAVKRTTRKP
jgi:uncharacterized delta-60 repeat protein